MDSVALPPSVDELRDELAALYADASRSINKQLADLLLDPIHTVAHRHVLLQRLRRLRGEVDRLTANIDGQARTWLSTRFPEAWQRGAIDANTGLPFKWTDDDLTAVTAIAREALDNLLGATRFVRADAKRLVRLAVRESAGMVVLEGEPLQTAARKLARTLEHRGIRAVRYQNGARHTLADYADTVIRTVTGTAYNRGTIGALRKAGTRYVQLFDGAGCGLRSHTDSDLANGTIRTLAEAEAYPLAHPRCGRSVVGRPDIVDPTQALASARLSPAEQQRQAREERAREQQQERVRRRSRRSRRTRRRVS